jgi:hypothetical protein
MRGSDASSSKLPTRRQAGWRLRTPRRGAQIDMTGRFCARRLGRRDRDPSTSNRTRNREALHAKGTVAPCGAGRPAGSWYYPATPAWAARMRPTTTVLSRYDRAGRIPRRSAIQTRSANEAARIFCITCPRWILTVTSLMPRRHGARRTALVLTRTLRSGASRAPRGCLSLPQGVRRTRAHHIGN